MRAVDIIAKKRDGQALQADEIRAFVEGFTRGDIPDYQAAAWLMAVYWRGMTREETVNLTLSMAHSGQMMDLSDISETIIDKHSSGGVGDKTSLVVLPLVAACGVKIAKMSGRGLGFSGGTLDKLEAIDGFRAYLPEEAFREQARRTGLVLAGQTADLAPADGKLYALRDVTATVGSLPLIASSIMSKKLAAGANGIVLDVKLGRGAFMKNLDDAGKLAKIMVKIGQDAGRAMTALLSDMNQPLGEAVGNALEVAEAIEALRGGGPGDLREHCLVVARHMLKLAGRGQRWTDDKATRRELEDKLDKGEAFQRFRQMIADQGGDVRQIDNPSLLPQAQHKAQLVAWRKGNVQSVAADDIAKATLTLGAGRARKDDKIDHAVGLVVHVNVGDHVELGEPLVTIHANRAEHIEQIKPQLHAAIGLLDAPADPLPLFYGVIEGERL